MMAHFCRIVPVLLVCVGFLSQLSLTAVADVTVEPSEQGATIAIDGQPFAEYRTLSGHQPAIWPLIGPTGKPITRSYPIGPLLEGEHDDHPHHHSLWFAHGIVNGHDFWLEPRRGQPAAEQNFIRHEDFKQLESGEEGTIVAHNKWLHGDELICEDERTFVFGTDGTNRWIDCTLKLIASNGPVSFGDTKEGAFSIRVAGDMKVDSKKGGAIVSSTGLKDAKAWGMPAEWVDYYGPVDGDTVGMAIFSHPSNFRHPCRWHVRTYGLFCANPFGEHHFPRSEGIQQETLEIPAGESVTLRYRVYIHPGTTEEAQIEQQFREYAGEQTAQQLPVLMREDFSQGYENWATTDPDKTAGVWHLEQKPAAETDQMLRVTGASKYQPPHRSPHSIALVKDRFVGDFELTAEVQNTNVSAGGHRDLCFFWGYQDPAHFYYVHLGAQPDPHSCQIFVVDDAPRTKITQGEPRPTPWSDGWHKVKVVRDAESGEMAVYFDDMDRPAMSANDTRFSWGRVGIGTFDDNGNFDEIELRGVEVDPPAGKGQLP